MKKVIGIDRKIRRHWLDILLDRFVTTADGSELRSFLDDQLKAELPGDASRRKSVGILLKTWFGIPENRLSLRERAIALLPRISGQERLWLHWGMMALAYPFFRDTAEVVGRLMSLQDDFAGANVQSRLVGSWGDRVTTKGAAMKLVHTLADWEVLRTTKQQSRFLLVQKVKTSLPELQLWLLEALLGASSADEIEAQQLLRLPELFPFMITVGIADLRRHEGFNIHRQGLDMDMVALRPIRIIQPNTRPEQAIAAAATPEPPVRRRKTTLFDDLTDEQSPVLSPTNAPATLTLALPKSRKSAAQRRAAKQLRAEFLESLDGRIERSLALGSLVAVGGRFAHHIAEYARLFRDGYFRGCLPLGTDLLQTIVLEMAKTSRKKAPARAPSFEKNVESLRRKKILSDDFSQKLSDVWQTVHDGPGICEISEESLASTSSRMLTLLVQLGRHSERFAHPETR